MEDSQSPAWVTEVSVPTGIGRLPAQGSVASWPAPDPERRACVHGYPARYIPGAVECLERMRAPR